MSYLDKTIVEINKALKEGKVSPKELYEEAVSRAKEGQAKYNAFVTILDKYEEKSYDFNNKLAGIPVAIKDNFSTRGVLSTGSSKILANYVPTFDATAVAKLKEAGANIVGKTVLDELAMGGTGTTGSQGIVRNPYDVSRQAGGSSAGSAAAVASGIVPYALGSDTGDSVRKPASLCGLVGFKPTWGRISRFGLFPFATSLDHVAYFSRCVEDAAIILETLAGKDENDMTASPKGVEKYYDNLSSDVKGKKIAVIKEIVDSITDKDVLKAFNDAINNYKKLGVEVAYVSMDINLLKAIYPTYMVISCAEATSNNANLDGIKFGVREDGDSCDEAMFNTRTKGFGEFIKRRFILGSYCLAREHREGLFLRAQRIRRVIVDTVNDILSKHDAIVVPASGDVAHKFDEVSERLSDEYLIAENHLAIANFGGLPSITIPMGLKDNMPIGINITSKAFAEQTTLDLAYALEGSLPYKNMMGGRK